MSSSMSPFDFPLNLSSKQIQYFAEDEPIVIEPKFDMPKLYFISGEYGPFKAGSPTSVPLWLAITLKKRRKCSIQSPQWLNIENLREISSKEREKESGFQNLPFHAREIAHLLLENAEDDVMSKMPGVSPDVLKAILEDLWTQRNNKLRNGMIRLSKADTFVSVELTNIIALEINTIRPFLVESISLLTKFNKAVQENPIQLSTDDIPSRPERIGNKMRKTK